MRITLHLVETEREWVARADAERQRARATLATAERDYALVATTIAAGRGLKPTAIGELDARGLVIDVAIATASDPESDHGSDHEEGDAR